MAENQDNNFDLSDRFGDKFTRYSDADIISILKKRNHYQPDAAKTAINEAIKRGIIHSEQDLVGEEYRPPVHRFTFFPVPENEYGKQKLGNSILRILVIVGIIPLIHGFIRLRKFETTEDILMIAMGLVWITVAWLMYKTRKTLFFYFLLLLIMGSAGYLVNHFINLNYVRMMDVFVSVLIILIVIYFLFYLKKVR